MSLGQRMTVMRVEPVDGGGVGKCGPGSAGAAPVEEEEAACAAELARGDRADDPARLEPRSGRRDTDQVKQAALGQASRRWLPRCGGGRFVGAIKNAARSTGLSENRRLSTGF